jgi:hypothetical protein
VFSTDLSTRSCDGHALVALRGELDLADAAVVMGLVAHHTLTKTGAPFVNALQAIFPHSAWARARRSKRPAVSWRRQASRR